MKKLLVDLSLETRLKIALDAARVFQYMHALGIVHRDIKSHNILIDHNMEVKVCDFGLARFKVSCDNYLRLILGKDRCNMQARQCTWRQSCSKSDSMMKKLTYLRLALFYGN